MSDENIAIYHPRHPRAAAILSTISPGLGQIYCGRFEAGMILFFTSTALLSLVPAALLLPGALRDLSLIAGIFCIAVWMYAAFDASHTARRIGQRYILKDYNRVSVYILLTLMAVPVALGCAIFVRSVMVAPYYVASDAMSPALLHGQRVLVSKLIYQDGPIHRGDIVALINPNLRSETNLRRVIALPGDHIEMRNGKLLVNNKVIASLDKSFPFTLIANGFCFVLADHQGIASDSLDYGPVPLRDVIGQVRWIYWPSWHRVAGGDSSAN